MSAPGATPGLWHVAGNHGYGDLTGHAIRDSQMGLVIAVTVTDVEPLEQESHANAHLIAASPALYDALVEAREDILRLANARWSEVEATDAEMVDYIDAALALARGEAA